MKPNPRVLLVEDDAISRTVLAAAIGRVPADVDTAATLAEAFRLASQRDYALWLIDAHLPDGSGIDLLARLRRAASATPALAHTASREATLHAALRAQGFAEVLVKPLPAQALIDAVRGMLALAATRADADARSDAGARSTPRSATGIDTGSEPAWDHAMALRALGGNAAHVAALQALFLAELPDVLARIGAAAAAGDAAAVHAELHKLQASCGFVGAARLDRATQAFRRECDIEGWARFAAAAQATLATPPHDHREAASLPA